MLQSALVIIDGSEETETVERFSIQLAKERKASLTGIGVVNTQWMTEPFPPHAGDVIYAMHGINDLKVDHLNVRKDLKDFGRLCAKNEISAHVIEEEGSPCRIIGEESFRHDLMIMGRALNFNRDIAHQTTRQIVRDSLHPLIMVPPQSPETYDRVLVAYEGGLQSARALQLFLLLGLGQGKKIDILTLHKQKDMAQRIVQQAYSMCQKHDIECSTHTPEFKRNPTEHILECAKESGAQMIVMGAFSHSTLREVLFGSTTAHLMERFDAPLFIHH